MSIALSNTTSEAALRQAAASTANASFKVGTTLELTVLERVQDNIYKVLLGNTLRTVQASSELPVGSRLVVQITASGEHLILRSADPRVADLSLRETVLEVAVSGGLAKLARRHHVAFDPQQLTLIERSMQQAEDPQTMANAGVFLAKLGLPIDSAALQAVYAAQVWPSAAAAAPATAHRLVSEDAQQLGATLQQHLRREQSVVDDAANPPSAREVPLSEARVMPHANLTANQGDSNERDARRELAQQLLNTAEGGGCAYQYGVLPLLIADQLVELDLLCFHSAANAAATGLRRLTMTFNSHALGRIEVHAEALGAALVLSIRAAAALPSEALAAHADEVRSLLARLGWRVDSLSYEHAASPRAAARLVQHVLRADTLDRWL